MRKVLLISALLLAASPAAAQVATSLSQRQLGGQSVRAERRWLRVERAVHIEQWVRNKQRVCIERRRWRVLATMPERTAFQRTVQLSYPSSLLARLLMTAARARGRPGGGLFVLLTWDREEHLTLSLDPLSALFRLRSWRTRPIPTAHRLHTLPQRLH